MKKHVQSINKECSLFIRGSLETESVMDMILEMKKNKKMEKNKKRTDCWGRALFQPSCPQSASLDPLPFDHSCAPGHWLYKDTEWQLLAAKDIQQPLLVAHAPSTATGCTSTLFPCIWEDTVATHSLHSLRRWSHKQPLTCNTHKSNLPLGFQFSVWICFLLSLHQREAGSSF